MHMMVRDLESYRQSCRSVWHQCNYDTAVHSLPVRRGTICHGPVRAIARYGKVILVYQAAIGEVVQDGECARRGQFPV